MRLTACVSSVVLAVVLFCASTGSADTVYAGNLDGSISKITSSGVVSNFVTLPGGSAGGPVSGLVFDPSGNLYASASNGTIGGGKIYKITPAGAVSAFASGMTTLSALTIDSHGNLFASNEVQEKVYEITPAGVVSTFATLPGEAEGLAFDASGNLFAATLTGPIVKISPAGSVSTFLSPAPLMVDLAFDGQGNLYVTNDGSSVLKITPAKVVTTFAGGLTQSSGEAFDSSGNLYVTNPGNGNSINKITTSGSVSVFASTGTPGGTQSVAVLGVASAPEPSTMALLAVAGAWLFARRR